MLALLLLLAAHAVDPPDEAERSGGAGDEAGDEAGDASDRPAPLIPTGFDLNLERQIAQAFRRVDGLEGVEVRVVARVARLSGQAADSRALGAAREIAGKFDALLYVDDRMTAPAPAEPPPSDPDRVLAERLRKLYAQVPAMSGLQVEVVSGVVKIRGEAPTADAQKAAITLAEKSPGAIYVDDQTYVAHAVDKRVAPAVATLQARARDLVARLPLFGVGLALLVAFWFGSRWIARLLFANRFTRSQPLLLGIAQQSTRVGIFLLGLVLVLDLLDLTTIVGAMLGTAGILGVAVGFAFRDIVENYLASLILTVRQPFAKGDLIEVAGNTGRVVRLTMRETVLATADGNHLRVPNATVFKSVLQNFTTNPLRRFAFKLGVAVDEDLGAAMEICRQALRETPGVLADPGPSVTLDAFADSAVTLNLAAWVNQRDSSFGGVRTSAMKRVKAALDAAGVDQPEPILRVYTGELRDGVPPPRVRAPATAHEEPRDEPEVALLQDREAAGEVDLLR